MSVSRKNKKQMDSAHVRATRAGDLFHYRWAATRVLNLLNPDSELESVSIEGGSQPCPNDYIIDVEECFKAQRVVYQLKYSTMHSSQECTLSFLGGTLERFGKLYKAFEQEKDRVEYVFLTNRPISTAVKNLFTVACVDSDALGKINKYLQLPNDLAKQFCQRFRIIDSVEDSNQQLHNVECRLMALTSANINNDEARAFVEFVAERAAEQNNVLKKASVLSFLGCSCQDDLLPARACYDPSFDAIETSSFMKVCEHIRDSQQKKVVVHAAGGIGKTAFLRWIHSKLMCRSILYDCYGGGIYRASNGARHRVRDAFVEIVNELYAKGLCLPILKWQSMTAEAICDIFWRRISDAAKALRCQDSTRCLYLLIDAADNANIAAHDNGDATSFIDHLIKADVPDGCRIVFTARSERSNFITETDNVLKIKLSGFRVEEVGCLISSKIPKGVDRNLAATVKNFARGNPRVILNLLSHVKTVEDLKRAISPSMPNKVPNIVGKRIQEFIRSLCKDHDQTELDKMGVVFDALAILPPTIPINVLSGVSGVEQELIESFIVEFGASFRFDGDMVHFCDEPTETYFRENYGKSEDCKRRVLSALEKLGPQNSYAALAIPRLLFTLGDYVRLFELAKTKDGIPDSNKTEARHLWLLRLEFAYRAALRLKCFTEVVPLAFLLAAEDSGNARQRSLVLDHLPFIASRICEDEVDFLCRDKELAWGWKGSHNLVVATLKALRNKKSPVAESYLQSTFDWMREDFNEYKQYQKKKDRQEDFANQDVCIPSESQLALVALVVYRINGLSECARFIKKWRPTTSRFMIASGFATNLLAIGGNVDVLLSLSDLIPNDPAVNLAWNLTLIGYGKSVGRKATESIMTFLKSSEPFSGGFQMPRKDCYVQAILAACEVAARMSLKDDAAEVVVVRVLRDTPYYGERHFVERNYLFLRAYALWLVLTGKSHAVCDVESFADKKFIAKDEYEKRIAAKEIEKRIGFYIATEKFFVEFNEVNLSGALKSYSEIISSYEIRDWERWEFDADCIELKLRAKCLGIQDEALKDASRWLPQKIRIQQGVDVSRRLMAFGFAKESIAYLDNAYFVLFDTKGEFQVEETADLLMEMSEIAGDSDAERSKRFYDKAFEILSSVGDETLEHFDALKTLMRRACEKKVNGDTVIRFLRCAEHAYGYDSKHFDAKAAFEPFVRHNMEDALAALSRFRDRGFGQFGYVLLGLLEGLVRCHGFSCDEVWGMRFLLGNREQLQLLEFVLLESKAPGSRQKYFDELTKAFSQTVERIDDEWSRLFNIAEKFALDDKTIRPYVKCLHRGNRHSVVRYDKRQKANKKALIKILQGIDYNANTWLVDYCKRTWDIGFSYDAGKLLLDNIPSDKYSDVLDQMAIPNGLSVWDVSGLLEAFPRERLGRDSDGKWISSIKKISERFIAEGRISELNYFVDLFPDAETKRAYLGDCLSRASETIGVSAHLCYTIIGLDSYLINPADAEKIAIEHIKSFEAEVDENLGDPLKELSEIQIENTHDAVAGVLWSALGSPVSWYRWNATYCMSALIENGCDSLIARICKCHDKFDAQYYMTADAAFYDGFAEMFFAIAINHAAAKNPRTVSNMIQWLISRYGDCRNAVIKWYYYEALKKSNAAYGKPAKEIVEVIGCGLRSRTPHIVVRSWGDRLQYDWDASIMNGAHGMVEYDVEKYWIPSLARVFGIDERAFQSIFDKAFRRVAERYDNWPSRLRYDYDKRDYQNESCGHSHGSYPRAFAFSTYVSFIALTELADELLRHYPVVKYSQEPGDNWDDWLKEHLLERPDGFWLSDECDPVPIDFVSDHPFVRALDEGDLRDALCEKIFSFASPIKNALPVGGGWGTSGMKNRINVRFYCVIVPDGTGAKYVRKLHSCKKRYVYQVPDLYSDLEKPPFVCRGKWRGVLQSWKVKDWCHFERYDPNYGGFDRPQIMIDEELQNILGAQRYELGKILCCGRKKIAQLLRWGTGEDVWSRRDTPKHVGSVLWMSYEAIKQIEEKLQCEIIVGARIERRALYTKLYVKPEEVYIWELAKNYTDK